MTSFKVVKMHDLASMDAFKDLINSPIHMLIESNQFSNYIDQMKNDGYEFVQYAKIETHCLIFKVANA